MTRSVKGFTLIELIIATVLAATVGATLMLTLRRQHRFYSSATEMVQVREQIRDGADVLVADLRGAAIARYGLSLMTDSALELVTNIGASVACVASSGRTIFLPPVTLASGMPLTSLLVTPDTGDLALFYSIPGGIPDSGRWIESRIAAFATRSLSTSCGSSSGFTSAADVSAGQRAYSLTLGASPVTPIRKGAPLRFLRRARYSLYRSSDGNWYLGYRRCNAIGASVCGTIQPVSGPYLAYGSSGSSNAGLAFRYYDASGAELTDASLSAYIARIDVVLRGETSRAVSLAGDAKLKYRDSAVVIVSPRNRAR